MRFRSLPIFWQTLVLLLVGLVTAQIVSVLLIIYLPAPRPDFYTMNELAGRLMGESETMPALVVHRVAEAPTTGDGGMIADPAITRRLAEVLGRPEDQVRLFFQADQAEIFPFTRQAGSGAVPMRHGQPYFFNTVLAAMRDPAGGWRVLRTPPPARITAWQQRTAIWFGISALAMLPFAWAFARRLTTPIRRFAHAVERLDHDEDAPPVPVEGPAELQRTASALNAMQGRLHAYLRERSAMIGAIAHDLRTPLARIAFRIERAPDAIRAPVQADIEQMREMVAATIGFVRDGVGVGDRRPVDLAALARRLAGQARDTGSPVETAALQPATVSGDRSALERLLQNLIDNAIKYAGGAELSVRHAIDRARLTVADRGPGIPDTELDRMFEPFARQEPSRSRQTGGLGLGLAIARSIAVAHGGSIVAENRIGGGLTVTVDLPLAG
jgi:signal transduction histidine kinase